MPSPLLVIVGETASGKSALALNLAKKLNGEIISADSWTVYKGFDIGTAKPTNIEQQEVPHHLLDIANPLKGFSAAEFKRQADQTINDILVRGKLPILVGGTGLYIDSVIFNYGFLPAGPQNRRQELDQLPLQEVKKLVEAASISTEGIDVRNKRRLIRLLESNGQRPTKQDLRPNTLIIGISTPKEELETRITKRVDQMLEQSLEHEVRTLSQKYGWQIEPMKGIGYREWQNYFNGTQTLALTRERIIRGSMQLAKKQRTWFRRNKYIHWYSNTSQIVADVTTFLNK
ncbi:MAG TPA: tRNA (adenosine(37)-N6)-dimethylallyltransferase MiaA [Candidatus Saccharimonadales bacterium]|nr:tRNA (adenosine(37)-N6)-dimethylallyltransferase MiaA [Candidatus Saccharimonadales bacterium]